MDDELPWDLKLDQDGSVYLQWRGAGNPTVLNLGPFEQAGDKLADFLGQNDHGE